MFSQTSYEDVKDLVHGALDKDSGVPVSTLAEQLNLTEGEVTFALPSDQVAIAKGSHTESILKLLPEWGPVTTIVHSFGSIFEFKNPFPKGKVSHGYYNIMGKEGLHGHLLIDAIEHVAFVSKPFRGMESHYIGFFDAKGHCVFKVYVGRDKARVLLSEQVTAFQELKGKLVE